MNINVNVVVLDGEEYYLKDQVSPKGFCCNRMSELYNRVIYLRGSDPYGFSLSFDGFEFNKKGKFLYIVKPNHFPECCFEDYYEIYFCPFCGEKIDYNIVDRIELTEVIEEEKIVRAKSVLKRKHSD